jgi:hypothetical protein
MVDIVETGKLNELAKKLLLGVGSCDSCKYCGGFDDFDMKFCWVVPNKMKALPEKRKCDDYESRKNS